MDAQSRTVVADPGTPSRLAGGFLRWQLMQPGWIVIFSVAAVVLVVATFVSVTARIATPLVLAVIWLAAIALLVLLTYTQTRRSIRAAHPPGSTTTVSVLPEHLRVTAALGTTELRYAAIRRVFATPTVVVLRTSSSPVSFVLPRELLADPDLERLRTYVSALSDLTRAGGS